MSSEAPQRTGHMRDAMPGVAAFIDSLREAFGADAIDPSIRAGMRGSRESFYATEAGHTLGTPWGDEGASDGR